MPITDIRIANIADIGAIRDLTRAAYAKWVPLIGREPRPMTADYEAAILRDRFDLIYLDGVCPSSEVLGQPGCGFSGGLASSGLEI